MVFKHWLRSAVLASGLALAGVPAHAGPAPSPGPLDYGSADNWVCRPGAAACRFDLTATRLGAAGPGVVERFEPARAPKADCFYIYPTVSESPGLSAEARTTEAELRAVRQQAARLASVCRLFVPLHRQITYSSMRPGFSRSGREAFEAADRLADADLLAAWDHYLLRDNGGRPFVIVGHSQGANRAIRLIQARIDGQAAQQRLLSAILPGAFVTTPPGRATGGTFKTIPPCRREGQVGCFLAFNAIRAETVLPADAKPNLQGQDLVCTDPAALAGGAGTLKPYLSTTGETIIPELTAPQPPWTHDGRRITTPFVTLPGLYAAECRVDEHGAFLAVTSRPDAADQRTGGLTGDWMAGAEPVPVMGLHLIDLNLTAGNLVDVISAQLRHWR